MKGIGLLTPNPAPNLRRATVQTCFFLRTRWTANSSFTMGKKNNQKLPRNRSTSSSLERNVGNSYFKEEDRSILVDTNGTVKDLKDEINALKLELNKTKTEVANVRSKNVRLNQALNLSMYSHDDFDQYNRRENICICVVPEYSSKKDDGEDALHQIANELDIEPEDWDIHRCHRLGKKPNPRAKPRPIIARFVSFKKRNEFLFAKAELKNSANFRDAFITEDLKQLRHKLLNYVKNNCDNRFVMCHSHNGKIRMKKSARTADNNTNRNGEDKGLRKKSEDEGKGNWIVVSSPDDLLNLSIDNIDFKALNYQPLFINRSDLIVKTD